MTRFPITVLLFVSVVYAGGQWTWAGTGTPTMTIRVMVAQNVAQIEIQGDDRLAVRTLEGQALDVASPAILTVTSRGVMLGKSRVLSERVTIEPSSGPLTVSTMIGNGGTAESRGTATLARWQVRGGLNVWQRGKGLLVVNEVDVEDYVMGVVPGEVNAGWHPEVLKAQAVAARTYALYQRTLSTGREYDVVAGIQDQVYQGTRGVDERVARAVQATKGAVVSHHGRPIYAAFSSTAAGPTEDALNVWSKDLPYLRGVDCPFDSGSPYYRWRVSVPFDRLEQNLRQSGVSVGTIASLTPFAYSRAGRVTRLRILHSGGELILRGEDLRKVVGYSTLPSTRFEVEAAAQDLIFRGFGSGHGVGMCQWGAKQLAELGYSFRTILAYYYPGTDIRSVGEVDLTPPPPA